jgi:hypothetical protein
MTQDELSLVDEMDTSALMILEQDIKVTRIRELRILQRIAAALEKERLSGRPTGEVDSTGREKKHAAMVPVSSSTTSGAAGNTNTLQQEAHSAYIMRLEAALTPVQSLLARLVAQREELVAASGVNKGGVINLFMGGKADERRGC